MIQIEASAAQMGEIAYFGDDLGMQRGLAIGPAKWRKYLKPCFMKMYRRVRESREIRVHAYRRDGV